VKNNEHVYSPKAADDKSRKDRYIYIKKEEQKITND